MANNTQAAVSSRVPSPVLRFFIGLAGFFRQMARYPLAFAGLLIVIFYFSMTLIGPTIAPYPFDQPQEDPTNCLERADGTQRCAALRESPPSAQYLFGTDRNGRDVFSRVLWGARETIGLPTVATLVTVFFGSIIGLSTGYLGGWYDEIISRIMDSLLSIPALILALVALSTIVPVLETNPNFIVQSFGATNIAIITVIVLLYTPIVTRIIRSATLNLRDRGYVEAARLRGEGTPYILFREILPGVLPALAVEASLRFSYAIFLVASLGFLGLGAQPPSPEWGRMVLDARANFVTAPWALWFPVAAIATLIISVNLMSDGLRKIFRNEQERD